MIPLTAPHLHWLYVPTTGRSAAPRTPSPAVSDRPRSPRRDCFPAGYRLTVALSASRLVNSPQTESSRQIHRALASSLTSSPPPEIAPIRVKSRTGTTKDSPRRQLAPH